MDTIDEAVRLLRAANDLPIEAIEEQLGMTEKTSRTSSSSSTSNTSNSSSLASSAAMEVEVATLLGTPLPTRPLEGIVPMRQVQERAKAKQTAKSAAAKQATRSSPKSKPSVKRRPASGRT